MACRRISTMIMRSSSGAVFSLLSMFQVPAGRAIGASTKIWYDCDFGRLLSSSLTYWIELLPSKVARQKHDADKSRCTVAAHPARRPHPARFRTTRRPDRSWSSGHGCRCGCRPRSGSGCPALGDDADRRSHRAEMRRCRRATAARPAAACRAWRTSIRRDATPRPAAAPSRAPAAHEFEAPAGRAVLARRERDRRPRRARLRRRRTSWPPRRRSHAPQRACAARGELHVSRRRWRGCLRTTAEWQTCYCFGMPAFSITAAHFVMSPFRRAISSSGELALASTPSST